MTIFVCCLPIFTKILFSCFDGKSPGKYIVHNKTSVRKNWHSWNNLEIKHTHTFRKMNQYSWKTGQDLPFLLKHRRAGLALGLAKKGERGSMKGSSTLPPPITGGSKMLCVTSVPRRCTVRETRGFHLFTPPAEVPLYETPWVHFCL